MPPFCSFCGSRGAVDARKRGLHTCSYDTTRSSFDHITGLFGSTHQGSFDVSYEQVVMRPGLTFNQMNQLHDQLQQTQWCVEALSLRSCARFVLVQPTFLVSSAILILTVCCCDRASRFGSNVPKQYTPPVSVWGAARAVPPREGPGLTLNLAPVEQASPLQNDRPLISLGDAGRYENERFAQQEGEGRGGEWEERNGGSGGGGGEADNAKDGGRGQEETFHARAGHLLQCTCVAARPCPWM